MDSQLNSFFKAYNVILEMLTDRLYTMNNPDYFYFAEKVPFNSEVFQKGLDEFRIDQRARLSFTINT